MYIETSMVSLSLFVSMMVLSLALFINSLVIYIKLRVKEKSIDNLHMEIAGENAKILTDNSEKLLNFIKMLSSQVAILRFRTFVDGHEITKVTKSNLKDLASEVAKNVKESINIDNIDFSSVLFTKEFYEEYIIETSIISVKSLLDKTIDEYE